MGTHNTISFEMARERFIQDRGTWSPSWEAVGSLDPTFLDAYRKLSTIPSRSGHLEPKVQELIFLAVDANATHLFAAGVEPHLKRALELGATREELTEVLELIATLGIHAMNIGVPILVEELRVAGLDDEASLDGHQQELKAEFTRTRGYWHEFWEDILRLAPDMFEAYVEFSSVPWRSGPLSPKVKELIYIAFDTAATHLYEPGLRLHIKNALGYGATAGEILEVMEIASTLGIHGPLTAAPALVELTNTDTPQQNAASDEEGQA
ncbi:carboxymuconolactone decarboxylase family protein [Brachybacterium sp. ACRRE]|uniref:carboxymuconolactone decarboxylase family protein n=1 Tax=Brachybacterium sp. ACRRE TaxID=2918184 RepID=UPI001EF34990|nr:carboxymuconolactone decarboxylase family protein [Brachybacterium sp. ACRRE]MCG7310727.1 carboxymuconolactone decarboxylase family protein [Brachybacterium sp. ACRRE]